MVPCTKAYVATHAKGLSSGHHMEAQMATITANATRETGLFGRIGGAVSDFFSAVAEARRMAGRYDYLSGLTASELARMGLTREDIPQAVVRGR